MESLWNTRPKVLFVSTGILFAVLQSHCAAKLELISYRSYLYFCTVNFLHRRHDAADYAASPIYGCCLPVVLCIASKTSPFAFAYLLNAPLDLLFAFFIFRKCKFVHILSFKASPFHRSRLMFDAEIYFEFVCS
jgi:hypothetical protein